MWRPHGQHRLDLPSCNSVMYFKSLSAVGDKAVVLLPPSPFKFIPSDGPAMILGCFQYNLGSNSCLSDLGVVVVCIQLFRHCKTGHTKCSPILLSNTVCYRKCNAYGRFDSITQWLPLAQWSISPTTLLCPHMPHIPNWFVDLEPPE